MTEPRTQPTIEKEDTLASVVVSPTPALMDAVAERMRDEAEQYDLRADTYTRFANELRDSAAQLQSLAVGIRGTR